MFMQPARQPVCYCMRCLIKLINAIMTSSNPLQPHPSAKFFIYCAIGAKLIRLSAQFTKKRTPTTDYPVTSLSVSASDEPGTG